MPAKPLERKRGLKKEKEKNLESDKLAATRFFGYLGNLYNCF